ncbi:peptide chain release factor N(5)-glutamine methyltransferase [Patescibacteria group bacterium]|nr:peptide chain release factor N(5)-glutamine methyltransferase [Patescibacteria group bacterium]MBU3999572.1 peptide chain release factor N(5)-glutamine methyltransferase [Patescibacteria group bacterium]MBU4056953.1 peptide chain release factor N(5)-glutamine methyltransferase [Patescibacteria group bacterium]
MTVREILVKGAEMLSDRKIKSSRLDAEIILLHNLRPDRSWLYSHGDYPLSEKQENEFFRLIRRRARFEPVAYIAGEKEFYGLSFYVDKNVLIPRPETEIMVEEALKDITWRLSLHLEAQPPSTNKKISVADIGTGSGAIVVSLAKNLKKLGYSKRFKIYATDVSAKALKVAKINAQKHNCGKNIIFRKGDLLEALPKNIKIDYLLANLPYVGNDYYYFEWLKNGSRPSEFYEIKHEPKKSLLAKNNGLEYFEKFFPSLPKYLAKNAKIFLESDPHQIKTIKKLAKEYLPNHKISVIKDLRGLDRITKIDVIL